ncbi:pyridoxal-phosphate dependent enzyme, partial [Klebsiella pneumoniae]|uniref:pyridoxal-phosphate dependent enzyme n=1 Tax=Klebsiella pneumoniae TaxID=573 RepID=UPI00202F0F02
MADSQPLSGAPEGAQYLRAVLRAPVYEAGRKRRCKKWISSRRGWINVILVKREDRQPVHSFKLRGAYAMMSSLTAEQKSHGVITASAGNHAQGVAFSASRLGVKALIVMPVATADIKSMPFAALAAKCCCTAPTLTKRRRERLSWRNSRVLLGAAVRSPNGHRRTGTLALELLQQDAHIDRVFVRWAAAVWQRAWRC